MQLVHAETGDVLASEVETADHWFEILRGLRFRSEFPNGHALIFSFERVRRRDVDMLFVSFPIDVLWLIDDRINCIETLRPWLGFKIEQADTIIELSAGVGSDVSPGDTIVRKLDS